MDRGIDAFVQLVLSDQALQAELLATNERHDFLSRVVDLGAQNGYEFSVADVEEAMRSNRQRWLRS